jgi:hypothetical protein
LEEQHPGGSYEEDPTMEDTKGNNPPERWSTPLGLGLSMPSEVERRDGANFENSGGK